MGLEVAVEILIAWVVSQACGAGSQHSDVADHVVGATAIRVKDLVLAKLGEDSALQRLALEATETGKASARTRTRVELALDEAAEQDPDFAAELHSALRDAEKSGTAVAGRDGIALFGGVHGHGSGPTIGVVGGDVTVGAAPDPQRPERA